MQGAFNTKIIGAIIVGFALVGGAYIISTFGQPSTTAQTANVVGVTATQRAPIVVSDTDNNGIEDWRDTFLTEEAIVVSKPEVEYTPPTTLTGQTGIHLAESIVHSRTIGINSVTDEDIITSTVNSLNKTAEYKLFNIEDISVIEDWDWQDVVNYANTVAAVVYRNDNPDLGYELDILDAVINRGQTDRISELEAKAQVYRNTLEETKLIPVPEMLAKQHIDLLNTYQAVTEDVEAMLLTQTDPIVTLLHLRRYQDSALSMYYALQNMYEALAPNADWFNMNDPALFFTQFSEDYQP